MNRESILSLFDAYQKMYEEKAFESWLNSVLDEGVDLSEYTMEEVYQYWEEEVLDEGLSPARARIAVRKPGGTRYTRWESEDPAKRGKVGGRGGRSDFGDGGRGGGHRSRRRLGQPVGDEDDN